MARAKTKEELLGASSAQFDKLWSLIDGLSKEEQLGTIELEGKEAHWQRDKNIRDILVHLYEWHMLLVNWVVSNKKGIERPFLREPYNWKTYGDMNKDFWSEHQQTSYEDAVKLFKKSHAEVTKLVEGLSEDELFTKGAFAWTGSSTLGQYCTSATASHYDWAIKKIKKYKKELGHP